MSDIAGAADSRPETPPLQMKIKLPPQDDGDPAEPIRSRTQSNETAPPSSPATEVPPAAASAGTRIAVAPVTPIAAVEHGDQEAAAPIRRSFRQPATVTFTNRLSVDHRELLQEMADLEGLTIRAILERSLDHYAAVVHPSLGN